MWEASGRTELKQARKLKNTAAAMATQTRILINLVNVNPVRTKLFGPFPACHDTDSPQSMTEASRGALNSGLLNPDHGPNFMLPQIRSILNLRLMSFAPGSVANAVRRERALVFSDQAKPG
jgi:hypothetical protein